MASKTLYPPILDSWMPSFVIEDGCKIKFNLSNFNSLSDINVNNIQVTIRDASNNRAIVQDSKGNRPASEILFKQLQNDGDEYYITISNNDVYGGFYKNKYYKVQIRFIDTKCGIPQNNPIWINSHLDNFSEWSTVCLIKGIKRPSITFKNLDGRVLTFYSDTISLIGSINFELGEKEKISSYQIEVGGFYDSGVIYTDEYDSNNISYTLKHSFSSLVGNALQALENDLGDIIEDADANTILMLGTDMLSDDEYYHLYFTYTTSNGYVETREYLVSIILSEETNFKATITVTPDPEEGYNIIHIESDNDLKRKQLVIRRASNTSRFLLWEDLILIDLDPAAAINKDFIDRTVKSGVWYQYDVTTIDNSGLRDNTIRSKIVTNHFYDAFLIANNKQLKIALDNKMSNFKQVVLESKVDTLGGKYPIIRRNGDVSYRTFPITGTISYHLDSDILYDRNSITEDSIEREPIEKISTSESFFKRDGYYGPAVNKLYKEYNLENNIIPLYDYVYERDFREEVMKFLQSTSIKLFKSMTEGNVLVRLMDVSFTPNDTIDRLVYSFSATAYEIAEDTIENHDKYNIQKIRR